MHLAKRQPHPDKAHQLQNQGVVSIPDFLSPEAAERLYRCLLKEVPWGLAFRLNGKPFTEVGVVSVDQLEQTKCEALLTQMNEPFQFLYNSYMMVTAYLEKRDPGLLLHAVLEWLNSPAVMAYFRALTGVEALKKINAQATRYLPGHFLKNHNDFNATEGRRYAYVLSLTKHWQADWGGLLHFTDATGEVVKTLVPRFNTLNVFSVPQDHCVSYVAPYASEPRLAITGWMLDK